MPSGRMPPRPVLNCRMLQACAPTAAAGHRRPAGRAPARETRPRSPCLEHVLMSYDNHIGVRND